MKIRWKPKILIEFSVFRCLNVTFITTFVWHNCSMMQYAAFHHGQLCVKRTDGGAVLFLKFPQISLKSIAIFLRKCCIFLWSSSMSKNSKKSYGVVDLRNTKLGVQGLRLMMVRLRFISFFFYFFLSIFMLFFVDFGKL